MELDIIKPTIGRVVWYKDVSQSDQFMAATICYVWNDDVVNLSIHNMHGEHIAKQSVTLFQGHADNCPDLQCCWPTR